MKAIIKFDVPEWQIGQDVTVHFPDTMVKHEKCELLKEQEANGTWIQKADATGHEYSMCSACETIIKIPDGCGGYYKLDMTGAKYCPNCGAKMD